ncbi:hypothetical protein [Halopiger xanaduensis]|uniref:Uncharacterized protein n=1 Tax=Halopiger xanaduensis (strain DSM 18323 / JCM 14033 / SH-6) TaxID=797210 RepID=F8DET2_HALXS|nr:hypothetical protein [Halopiger xanaduensis]AEH39522.1 hypothetical protein Halxa_0282 [Halopiger xanaduensis SH-6]
MPSIQELKREILESHGDDWEFFDDPQTYVYSPDPRLRIEQYGDRDNRMDYNHTWVNRYHHSEDTEMMVFRVYFNESPIDHLHILRIDEHRCKMPTPHTEPSIMEGLESRDDYDEVSISRYEDGIGRAMTGDWEHYKNVGDITVRDEDGI